MDLSLYNVIIGPVISDKAYKLNKGLNKLILKVHPAANKPMLKEALEKLFSVKVENINMFIRKGKNRRMRGGRKVEGSDEKRAIVSLKEGYRLDLFDQAGSYAVAADASAKGEKAKTKINA